MVRKMGKSNFYESQSSPAALNCDTAWRVVVRHFYRVAFPECLGLIGGLNWFATPSPVTTLKLKLFWRGFFLDLKCRMLGKCICHRDSSSQKVVFRSDSQGVQPGFYLDSYCPRRTQSREIRFERHSMLIDVGPSRFLTWWFLTRSDALERFPVCPTSVFDGFRLSCDALKDMILSS